MLYWSPRGDRPIYIPKWQLNPERGENVASFAANIRDAALAPDEERFAFIDRRFNEAVVQPLGDGHVHSFVPGYLVVNSIDGSVSQRLVTIGDSNRRLGGMIRWSPDSAYITYDSDFNVNVVSSAGGDVVTLGAGSDPFWSPDGAWLVYTANIWEKAPEERPQTGAIIRAARDGSERRIIAQGVTPQIAPDGVHVAFINSGALLVVNADGTGQRQLATGLYPDYINRAAFSWSPDSARIAFVNDGIWVADVESGATQAIAPIGTRWAVWRPGDADPLALHESNDYRESRLGTAADAGWNFMLLAGAVIGGGWLLRRSERRVPWSLLIGGLTANIIWDWIVNNPYLVIIDFDAASSFVLMGASLAHLIGGALIALLYVRIQPANQRSWMRLFGLSAVLYLAVLFNCLGVFRPVHPGAAVTIALSAP